MSTRWTAVITSAGLGLLADVQGRVFNFTRAQCGAGYVDVPELENQTAVSDFKKNLGITSISTEENVTKLRLQLSNTSIATSFNLYQVGVFAKLDNDPEDVLFMIIQADTPDYIPSETESPNFVNDYLVNVIVGNADSVSGTFDVSAYVTVGLFDEKFHGVSGHNHDGQHGNGPLIGTDGIQDDAIGNEQLKTFTVDHLTEPETDTGKPGSIFSWLANRIKAITGKADWKIAPRTTLENAVKLNGDIMTGELSVPNLILLGRPLRVNYSTLYIDEVNGDDSNDGLTPLSAVKTSAGLNAKLPIFLNSPLTIKILGNFNGTLFINSVFSPSIAGSSRTLTIEGDTLNKANHVVFGIRIYGCACEVVVRYLSVVGNALVFGNCSGAYVNNCTLTTNTGSAGALTFASSSGTVENCELNNSLSSGLLATRGSVVQALNNTGVSVNAYVVLGAIIIKTGTKPSGNEIISNGGAIFNECRGNEPPKETIITNGFASGWSGTLKYGLTEDGEFYINHNGLIKTSDISPYEVIYTITAPDYSRYVGSASSFGLNASTIVVNNSTVTIHLESGGRLVASNHGSVTANVRKVWPDTIIARKF